MEYMPRARTPRSRAAKRRRAAAYHEAGHLVAAYHLNVRFRAAAIGVDEGARGFADLHLLRLASNPERAVIVTLAGAEAERVATGRYNYRGGAHDLFAAIRYAQQLSETDEEVGAYLKWMRLRTRRLVRSNAWRRAVDSLARALVERGTVRMREARAIIAASGGRGGGRERRAPDHRIDD